MSALVLYRVAGPWPGQEKPDPHGFTESIRAAQAVERRAMNRTIGHEDERRYVFSSAAIERIARRIGTAVLAVDPAAFSAWAEDCDAPRSQACFHLPGEVGSFVDALLRSIPDRTPLRAVLQEVAQGGDGLVLVVEPTSPLPLAEVPDVPKTPVRPGRPRPDLADALPRRPNWSVFASSEKRSRSADALWDEAVGALAADQPVLLGASARHEVIAEVLAALSAHIAEPAGLRVLYVDGSETTPFPLRPAPPAPAPGPPDLRLGLMSIRHTELDADVDGYWFRNRLVSTPRSMAETDAYCAEATIGQLDELTAASVRSLQLFHTGFEAAVVGFYRGLRSWRPAPGRTMLVEPVFLMGTRMPGTSWIGGTR